MADFAPVQETESSVLKRPLLGVLGVGFEYYGARNVDLKSETFVKTRFLTFFHVPVFALGAYRFQGSPAQAAKAMGRVPMTLVAKSSNFLVCCLLIAAGWFAWSFLHSEPDPNSPRQRLAYAELMVAEGRIGKAALLYDERLFHDNSPEAKIAIERLKALLGGPLEAAPPDEVATLIHVAAMNIRARRLPISEFDLAVRALYLAESTMEIDPKNASRIFFPVASFRHKDIDSRRRLLLERLIAKDPQPARWILEGAAQASLEHGLKEIVGEAIDWSITEESITPDVVKFLCKDEATFASYQGQLRSHPDVGKARMSFFRLVRSFPADRRCYAALSSLCSYSKDLDGMKNLVEASEALAPPRPSADLKKFYRGEQDISYSVSYKRKIDSTEETLKTKLKGITAAVLADDLVRMKIRGSVFGLAADPDEIVRLAEEYQTAYPSEGSFLTALEALCFRADQSLAKLDPTYATLSRSYQRSLGSPYILAVALRQQGKLRSLVLDNSDIQRILKLLRDWRKKSHQPVTGWALVMLRAGYPQEADDFYRELLQDEFGEAKRTLEARLSPHFATYALDAYWALELANREAEGKEFLNRCAELGVPVPLD